MRDLNAVGDLEADADVARLRGLFTTSVGCVELRNVSDPQELFELVLVPTPEARSVDPVCRMRVEHARAAGELRHYGEQYWFCSLDCAAAFAASTGRHLG